MNHVATSLIAASLGLFFASTFFGFAVVFVVRPTASATWFRNLLENAKYVLPMDKSRANAIRRATPGIIQIQGFLLAIVTAVICFRIGFIVLDATVNGLYAVIGTILIFLAGVCFAVGIALGLSAESPRSSGRWFRILLVSSFFLALAGVALTASPLH